jgi:hypothetical protein
MITGEDSDIYEKLAFKGNQPSRDLELTFNGSAAYNKAASPCLHGKFGLSVDGSRKSRARRILTRRTCEITWCTNLQSSCVSENASVFNHHALEIHHCQLNS